jgi:uncharacterized protein (DUF4415 family)
MKTKNEHITQTTAEDMKRRRMRGEAGSDWRQAANKPIPDGRDPDDAIEPFPVDWVTTKLPEPTRKAHMTLRLDADVHEWFRAQGRGYQTKINAILRSYFEQHRRSS